MRECAHDSIVIERRLCVARSSGSRAARMQEPNDGDLLSHSDDKHAKMQVCACNLMSASGKRALCNPGTVVGFKRRGSKGGC